MMDPSEVSGMFLILTVNSQNIVLHDHPPDPWLKNTFGVISSQCNWIDVDSFPVKNVLSIY